MKKNGKRVQFLVSLLFIAAAAFALKRFIPTTSYFRPVKLMTFSDQGITRITLTGETKNQALIQKNGAWFVEKNGTDFKADTSKVDTLLKTLHALTAENIVSRNMKKQADFGIGKAMVVLQTPGKKYTVYVGSPYLSEDAYVRFDGQNEIFIGSGMGVLFLDGDYRDLSVPFLTNTGEIQSVEINSKGTKSLLTRTGNTWRGPTGAPLSNTIVESYLNDLASLQASDILPLQPSLKGTPDLIIRLKTKDKTGEMVAEFYPGDQSMKLFFTGAKALYEIPKVYVSSLEKKEADFIQPTTQP